LFPRRRARKEPHLEFAAYRVPEIGGFDRGFPDLRARSKSNHPVECVVTTTMINRKDSIGWCVAWTLGNPLDSFHVWGDRHDSCVESYPAAVDEGFDKPNRSPTIDSASPWLPLPT
jgi:hypothetical protein